MSVVDIVLGYLVLGLAGWALVQTGSAKPASRGCGGGCSSHGCGSGEQSDEDESLVTLGGDPRETARDR